ncbi:dienelactone hydrolase family protein [Mucilaginibacter sp.]|uniref:dienelactone hydrolase family protein n=2 Tax=Mucilaginibacter sp. TaxID=1882438 RepID=UPI003266ECA6
MVFGEYTKKLNASAFFSTSTPQNYNQNLTRNDTVTIWFASRCPEYLHLSKTNIMSQINKDDIKQEVFDLYDDYAHNRLDRRAFVQKLSLYAVGGLTVPALMSFLMPDYKGNVQIKSEDPRLKSEYINYPSPKGGGTIKGLLSKPIDAKKKLGGIIVVHENRGLNPYIEDVGRRAALAGFISLAPDALTPLGGYPGNDDAGREMQSKRDKGEMEEDFIAAYNYLKSHKDCTGKVGVVGFCYGGGIANMMAVRVPDLAAAVPFYGSQPAAADVPKINAPLMMHNASLDTRIMAGAPAYEAALKENGKKYQAFVYENVNHGFHNDTTPRYDKAAAELAWKRTIDFFAENLK